MPLSIIIPCYNEEIRINDTIEIMDAFKAAYNAQVIYVDDGSIDSTSKIIKSSKNQLITYKQNRGKGYAIRRGLAACKNPNILILDADLSVMPHESLKWLEADIQNKLVIGTRLQTIRQPLYRILLGKVWQALVWLRIDYWGDTQCPYKLLLNIPKKVMKKLSIDGFAYDVELIKACQDCGIEITKQQVKYYNQPDSKVTFSKTLRMASDLFRI